MGLGTRPQELIQLGIERRTPPSLPLPQLTSDEKLKALLGAFATMAGYGMTVVAILLLVLSVWFACSQYFLLSSWSRADAEIVNSELYSQVLALALAIRTPNQFSVFDAPSVSRPTAVSMSHERILATRSQPRTR